MVSGFSERGLTAKSDNPLWGVSVRNDYFNVNVNGLCEWTHMHPPVNSSMPSYISL